MNKPKQSTNELYQQLCTLIELSESVVSVSTIIPNGQKKMFLADYKRNTEEAKEFAEQNKASFLKQLVNEVLTPWQETDDADSKQFWHLVRQRGLPIEQKDYLAKILKRGRITNPTEYELVQDSIVIWQHDRRITAEQANNLNQMIADYEQKQTN
jgi:hypothetical protein